MAGSTTTNLELQSFLWKFAQLSSFGFDADINFGRCKGNVTVKLSANLGTIPQYPTQTCPEHGHFNTVHFNLREKPSKVKRRSMNQVNLKNRFIVKLKKPRLMSTMVQLLPQILVNYQ